MTSANDLLDRPIAQRVALASLARLSKTGDCPAHTGELVRVSHDLLETADVDALGRVGEADLKRALNRLEADEIVEAESGEHSPVGKGRPAYSLAVDSGLVAGMIAEDGALSSIESATEID